jgi:glycosyltransferase involved in cell wall biosynthesis
MRRMKAEIRQSLSDGAQDGKPYSELISVVIPVLNGESYIRECIASVVAQSYRNLEIVVADNRSTDRTAQIVESFSDPRIKRLASPDRQLSIYENWERALRAAQGDFVKVVAHDDAIKPDCVERQAKLLSEVAGASFIASRRTIIDARGRIIIRARGLGMLRLRRTPRVVSAAEIIGACARSGTNLLGEPAAVLFRRACLPEPILDPTWHFEGDLDLYFRCLERGPAIIDREVLAFFRVSPQQMSASVADQQAREMRTFFRTVAQRYPGAISRVDFLFASLNSLVLSWARRTLYSYQRLTFRQGP